MNTIIPRHKAAIARSKPSRPVLRAIEAGLITPERSVFDYGCGYGFDAEWLNAQGYCCDRYDPYYFPDNPVCPADVVMLSFVLSVIENKAEREQTLLKAYELAGNYLIVGFLVDSKPKGTPYADGYMTKWGTFEKPYTAKECTDYLLAILGQQPVKLDHGIYAVPKAKKFKPLLACNSEASELKRLLLNFRKQRQRLKKEGWIPPSEAYLEAYSPKRDKRQENSGSSQIRFRLRSPNCNLLWKGDTYRIVELGDDTTEDYRQAEAAIVRRDKLELIQIRINYLKQALKDYQPKETMIAIAPPPTWIAELMKVHLTKSTDSA